MAQTTIKAILIFGRHGKHEIGPIFDHMALDSKGIENYEKRVRAQIETEVRERGLRELWEPDDEDALLDSVKLVWKDTGTIFPGDVLSDKQVLYDLQLEWNNQHGVKEDAPEAPAVEEPAPAPVQQPTVSAQESRRARAAERGMIFE